MKKLNIAALPGVISDNRIMKCMAALFAAAALTLALVIPADYVNADTMTGSSDWSVEFTKDKEMVSNFKTADLDEVIFGMQPGDNAKLTMQLSNENDATTDWYMTNKVLHSLEDRSKDKATAGGAYTYKLTYTNPDGEVKVLFDSDTVGGDDVSPAGEGLKEATDALQDYVYLDKLSKGKTGRIDLEVGLDGETQNNDYQDTLADLQMNFAVELSDNSEGTTESNGTTTESDGTTRRSGNTTRTTVVKTGDDNNMLPYFLVAGAGGLFLLFFALFCILGSRNKRKEGAGS